MSDLISREAAIEAIESHLRVGDEVYPLTRTDKILNHAFEIAASCVYNLPTAEKVGKWKYETMRHIITGEMRTVRICSECGGGWFRYDLSDGVEDSEPNYCPNCGARMRGADDDN